MGPGLPVAQPGQSNGLLSRGSQVQILPGRPNRSASIPPLTHKFGSQTRPKRRADGPLVVGALTLLLSAVALAHGSLEEQIAFVTKEITAHPDDPRLSVRRGELHRYDGHTRAALEDFDRALRIDPSIAEAHLGRGRTLLAANRPRAAQQALREYLRLRPSDPEGHIALARSLGKVARPGDAADEYSRAIALLPRPGPDVFLERARALADAGRAADAIRSVDQGLAQLGPIVALQTVAIDLEVRRKNWDAALARLDRAAAPFARRETWLARRGEILVAAGRPQEARAAFAAALTSIDSLPERLKRTRAVSRLEENVRRSVAALENRPGGRERSDAKS